MSEATPQTAPRAAEHRPTTLVPVAAAFVVFGSFWGGWAVAVADAEKELGLSHGMFGVLLSAALAAAGVANALGGALSERHGSAPVLGVALAAWAALLLAASAVPHRVALGLLLIALIAAGGIVDTVMNVAATAALEPGSLVRFHALFNTGAAVGALVTGLLVANDMSWRVWFIFVAVAAAIVAVACARSTLPVGEPGEHAPLGGAIALLRREHLVMVAIAFAMGALVEGGVELWGVLFLRTHLPSGLLVGTTSAVLGYTIAACARVFLGPAAGRHGAARGVFLGAGTATIGILLLALAPGSWLPGLGLVIAAGGISMCWPLLLSHASAGRERPGAVVGAVSGVGYIGFFAGPVTVGWVAAAAGLQAGLVTLAGAAVFVALAPNLRRRPSMRGGANT